MTIELTFEIFYQGDGVAHATKHFGKVDLVVDMATLTGESCHTHEHTGESCHTYEHTGESCHTHEHTGESCHTYEHTDASCHTYE